MTMTNLDLVYALALAARRLAETCAEVTEENARDGKVQSDLERYVGQVEACIGLLVQQEGYPSLSGKGLMGSAEQARVALGYEARL